MDTAELMERAAALSDLKHLVGNPTSKDGNVGDF